jgi:hypothetical protein
LLSLLRTEILSPSKRVNIFFSRNHLIQTFIIPVRYFFGEIH